MINYVITLNVTFKKRNYFNVEKQRCYDYFLSVKTINARFIINVSQLRNR